MLTTSLAGAGVVEPGADIQILDRDFLNIGCGDCALCGHYTRNCPNRKQHQQQINKRQRMRGGMGIAEEIFHHKTTIHSDADCRDANVTSDQLSRVGMCSAFIFPEQATSKGYPTCFSDNRSDLHDNVNTDKGNVAIWPATNRSSSASPDRLSSEADQIA